MIQVVLPALQPIPTKYAGTQFRSRLEARWAAFFDLGKWRWEYEPSQELGWLPDFLLIGANHVVKVEVKLIQWVGNGRAVIEQVANMAGLDKVRRYIANQPSVRYCQTCTAKHTQDILVLGSYPHFPDQIHIVSSAMLGVFLREQWGQADIAYFGAGNALRNLDFYAANGSYEYRMGGEGGAWSGRGHLPPCDDQITVPKLRCAAGNIVQWRAPA